MNKYVYHGSTNGNIDILKVNKSTHLKDYVYATTNPCIALVFAVHNLGDLDFDLRIIDDKVMFTERREGAFNKYNNGGYLYKLDGSNFYYQEGLWDGEVVSEKEQKVLSKEYIPNVLKELYKYVDNGDMIIYRYPDKPEFISNDDSDLVEKYINFEKMGHKGAIDTLLIYFPHLKDKVFSKLEEPNTLYYIDIKKDSFNDIEGYDNVIDTLSNNNTIFERDNGWLNYTIDDNRFIFDNGGFNYNEDFYLYEVSGKVERISTHKFRVSDVIINSRKKIDLHEYEGANNMKFDELKSPEELMEYMDKNIQYGWIDNDGNKHVDTLEDFREKYRTSSIGEILDTGLATCIGQAKLIKYFFDKMNIPNKLYCYRAYEKDDNFNEKVKMHCFVLFKKDNSWYWFEHSMGPVKGIHKFDSLDSALDNITCKWKKGERELTEIEDIPDGLSYKEFNLYVNCFDKKVKVK